MDKQPSGVNYVKLQMYGATPYDVLLMKSFGLICSLKISW
jgi:hypothetical protein